MSVRDTGIGIAAEQLPHLFEMFSQVDPALERSQGGLGIGLALVRGLVEMHGGTRRGPQRGLGKGSEFVVRLPVAGPPVVPAAGAGIAARGGRRGADVPHPGGGRQPRRRRQPGHGCSSWWATRSGRPTTALEAVHAAAAFRPEVVLLDIGLPRMNGYEAAAQIREQPWGRDMMLVAVTGWGQEEDKRRALDAGFDHHLTKPVDPAAVEELLSRLDCRAGR